MWETHGPITLGLSNFRSKIIVYLMPTALELWDQPDSAKYRVTGVQNMS